MKKIITLAIIGAAVISAIAYANDFKSAGDKTTYTFDSLCKIDTSGVTKQSENVYSVAKSFTISAGDTLRVDNGVTLKLGDKVQIVVAGVADFSAVDTATITKIDTATTPTGLQMYSDQPVTINNVTFDYCALSYGSTAPLTMSNCTFQNVVNTSSALSFFRSSDGNSVSNCRFISNVGSGIQSGLGLELGIEIKDNIFYDNNTKNTNRPQINLNSGGDYDVTITGNTVTGTKRTKVGGIGLGNMAGIGGTNKVDVENNIVKDCRYGFTSIGIMNVILKNNSFIDDRYDVSSMSGGSGISLYDPNYKQTAMITGNRIEGNLWGITVIGCGNVNLGKTDDGVSAADYNPGNNIFKDNGNDTTGYNLTAGHLFDLFNNSSNTVYAQGNTWNVDDQADSVAISKVIYDVADNSALGEVVYMSRKTGISPITVPHQNVYFDASSYSIISNDNIEAAYVYATSGQMVYANTVRNTSLDLSTLPNGFYIAKVITESGTSTVKFIKR